jgi:hypothetical protein
MQGGAGAALQNAATKLNAATNAATLPPPRLSAPLFPFGTPRCLPVSVACLLSGGELLSRPRGDLWAALRNLRWRTDRRSAAAEHHITGLPSALTPQATEKKGPNIDWRSFVSMLLQGSSSRRSFCLPIAWFGISNTPDIPRVGAARFRWWDSTANESQSSANRSPRTHCAPAKPLTSQPSHSAEARLPSTTIRKQKEMPSPTCAAQQLMSSRSLHGVLLVESEVQCFFCALYSHPQWRLT